MPRRPNRRLQEAEETVAGRTEGARGRSVSGAPDGCANYLLPQVCASIADENPDLDVQIVALPRVVNLSKREVDMAVAVSAPTAGRLTVQKICDYQLHLAASRRYVRRHGCRDVGRAARPSARGLYPRHDFRQGTRLPLENLDLERMPLASNSASVQLMLMVASNAGDRHVLHDFALPSRGARRAGSARARFAETQLLPRCGTRSDRRLERLNRFAKALTEGMREEVARLEGLA